MCFNQRSNISALKGGSLKLMHKFTYLGSSVSSTEKDINIHLAKVYTAIDRLLVIRKPDLTDKIKLSFFPSSGHVSICYMDTPHGHWLNVWRKSLTAITQECCELYWTSPGSSTPQNSSCTATTTHHENYQS